MSYIKDLREIQSNLYLSFDKDLCKTHFDKFKEKYPGNYHLDWAYVSVRGTFTLKLHFDTPEDETWFEMKYS